MVEPNTPEHRGAVEFAANLIGSGSRELSLGGGDLRPRLDRYAPQGRGLHTQ